MPPKLPDYTRICPGRCPSQVFSVWLVDRPASHYTVRPAWDEPCAITLEVRNVTSIKLTWLAVLSLGMLRSAVAGPPPDRADLALLETNALCRDDQTRWRAQEKLYLTKDKSVVPILVQSLNVEGQRTEEKP